jgi:hypothetical protein
MGMGSGIGSALQTGVASMMNPKKGIVTGDQVQSRAHGGEISDSPKSFVGKHVMNMKVGGKVPGKAKVDGDSSKNDTVPAMLSPGEIVIPRSKVKDPEKAKAFVEAILRKKGIA